MLEWIRENGVEGLGRYYSTYRGIVIDNKDPNNCNRILVDVPDITYVNVWAYPKGQQGSLGSGFKMLTPDIQDVVFVEFENGDPNYPLWSYCGWAKTETPKDLQGNKVMGFITPKGNRVTINDETNECTVQLMIDENTQHEIKVTPELIKVTTPKPIEVTANGEITVTSVENLNLNGKNIIHNEGSIGTTMTDRLLTRINILEKDINMLKKLLASASSAAVPQDGGKVAFSTFLGYGNTPLVETQMADIEHQTVKQ